MVRIAIIVLLLSVHVFCGVPEFFYDSGPYWLRAATYSFFHANIWHLAINCIAVWTVFRPTISVTSRKWHKMFLAAYIIAVLVYPFSLRPVIGFSNILYATIGLNTPRLSSPWWRRTSVIIFIAVTALMIFFPVFSASTHIASFLLGMAGAAIRRSYQALLSDAARYLR